MEWIFLEISDTIWSLFSSVLLDLPQSLFRIVLELAQLAGGAARGANPTLQAVNMDICQRALAQTRRHESANKSEAEKSEVSVDGRGRVGGKQRQQ